MAKLSVAALDKREAIGCTPRAFSAGRELCLDLSHSCRFERQTTDSKPTNRDQLRHLEL
ncbi:MAG: hypothetical protein P8179_06370 [Candidatus Thiodiazotropha sp.]|jgi:hypothetical protein